MLAFIDSPIQLLLAAVVILVVFGPQKLPEIAGQIGRALRELKRTTGDLQIRLILTTTIVMTSTMTRRTMTATATRPRVRTPQRRACRKAMCGSRPRPKPSLSPRPPANPYTGILPLPRFRRAATIMCTE